MIWYQGFFGGPRDVARRLYDVPRSVVRSRYYALLLQSGVGADVRVFVRAKANDAEGEVRDWAGERLSDLPARILLACWESPGDDVDVMGVIDGFANYGVRAGISCPPTSRGAFGHQLRRHETEPDVHAFVVAAAPDGAGTAWAAAGAAVAGTQVHCLSGGYREVAVALFALPRSVVDSDWYLLLLDNGHEAAVHLFTRTPDRAAVLCHEWSGGELGDLPVALLRAADSGDDLERVLRARCDLAAAGPSLAPISVRGSFGRPFDSLRGEPMRALVIAR